MVYLVEYDSNNTNNNINNNNDNSGIIINIPVNIRDNRQFLFIGFMNIIYDSCK